MFNSVYLQNTITIDPGIHTGLAYWVGFDKPIVQQITDHYTKCKQTWKRIDAMCNSLELFIHERPPKFAVIEGISFWATSARSFASVSSGDMFLEAYLIGAYIKTLTKYHCENIMIVMPQEWKGQLSKDNTAKRVKAINNSVYNSDHITDAVAIGFSISGHLDYRKKRIDELYQGKKTITKRIVKREKASLSRDMQKALSTEITKCKRR